MDVLGVFVVVASAPLDILVLKVDLTGDLTPLGTPTAKLQGAALTCHLSPAACQCPVEGHQGEIMRRYLLSLCLHSLLAACFAQIPTWTAAFLTGHVLQLVLQCSAYRGANSFGHTATNCVRVEYWPEWHVNQAAHLRGDQSRCMAFYLVCAVLRELSIMAVGQPLQDIALVDLPASAFGTTWRGFNSATASKNGSPQFCVMLRADGLLSLLHMDQGAAERHGCDTDL